MDVAKQNTWQRTKNVLKIIKIIKIIKIKRRRPCKFMWQERMSQKRVNHIEVHNTAQKEKKQDSRTNPKKRKKYGCIHTEQRNSKKTSKK